MAHDAAFDVARPDVTSRGLSSAEVEERRARGMANVTESRSSRTLAQIVRANVFTRFNAILGAMFVVILIVGPLQDAVFGFIVIANALIGIVQEVRAKWVLDRVSVITAPSARVLRDGEVASVLAAGIVVDEGELRPAHGAVPPGLRDRHRATPAPSASRTAARDTGSSARANSAASRPS